jgi:Bacterial SCP ortholog
MPPRRPDPRGPENVAAVLRALDAGASPDPEAQRAAARYLLYTLAARHPGRVLEVRIPPVAAVQCLPGPVHTRGTPPNVVETDPVTWIRLASGRLDWAAAVRSGVVHASGPRADLEAYLPLL